MFYTNYVKIERKVFCNDDCKQGGCPSHLLELCINNTAGVAVLKKDGKEQMWIDDNEGQALYEMLKELSNE